MEDWQEIAQNLEAERDRYLAASSKSNSSKSVLPIKKPRRKPTIPSADPNERTSAKPVKKKPWKPTPKPEHRITLRVRRKQLAEDEEFMHESFAISKLEAENEARKAAEAAGYPIHTFIINWDKLK